MNGRDRFSDYINSHPRESLRVLVIGLCFLWQSMVALIGAGLYLLLVKVYRLQWWVTLTIGLVLAACSVFFQQYYLFSHINLIELIHQGWILNVIFWNDLITGRVGAVLSKELNYVLGFPLLLAGILSVIDLIPTNPHEKAVKALQKGDYDDFLEVSDKEVDKALANLADENVNGTVLGISKYSGKPVVIADRDVNQIVLVLGTTGGGKTVTLRRFYRRAIMQGYPLIIVDGKPDEKNVEWLMTLAKQQGKPFFGFNCGNTFHYDCLTNGGYTELKDKIISLKDEWQNDYYRSIAEDYLQTTFEVLLKSGKEFDLKMVVECLNYDDLALLVRATKDKELMKRVSSLESYDRKDITGLQAHLNILIHSELGQFFEKNETTFTLSDAIQQNAVVYFALPALRFPSFSKVLGKLVINDLKAVIDRQSSERVFMVFDEFSVFAGEQVLNLVNMGRGKGVHAVFGTQGTADLEKTDPTFKNQVLNCVNTLICHRLNDQDSAESVASWVGTQDTFTVTAQINIKQNDAGMGSVRRNKEFIVHPDAIKQKLQAGEAFYITKVGSFRQDKVKVKFS